MDRRASPAVRPTRRHVIQGAAAAAAVGSLPRLAFAGGKDKPPNILFVLADDLGYADLSCYGARAYKTPVLDKLAADGLLMTDGYSNSPVCSPTRVALITGRYQYRERAGLEEPIGPREAKIGLSVETRTLPAMLKRLGYRTSLVGKWHMGFPPEFSPLRNGYDGFFGIAAGATNYFTHKSADRNVAGGPIRNALYEGSETVEREGYLTNLFADRAINDIQHSLNSGQPFFVSLHFTAPHSPWQGPGDAEDATAIASSVHADGGSLEKYAEMVVAMDHAIGRVQKALEAAGVSDDTIVVFTSDNGGERFSDVWPFSGGKQKLLEGGIRVPVLVRWPSHIKPGSRSPQVVASMDWAPTLIEAAGGAPDTRVPFDGVSLLEVIAAVAPPFDRKLYWRFKRDDQAAVRHGKWKYLRRRGREYLFDLSADPRERANLKQRHAQVFSSLQRDFARWNATMPPYPADSFSAGGGSGALADD